MTMIEQSRLLPLLFTLLLISCGRAEARPKKAKYRLKIATLAPEGTVWMKAMRSIVDHVENKSGGDLRVRFYTGGVMGDEPDVVRKMKLGQLDGSGVSLTGVRLTCPEFQVLEMPFLFDSDSDTHDPYAEAEHVLFKMYDEFDDYAAKHGYRIVVMASAGFAHICSKKPLDNILRDFPVQRVWQWEGETVMKAISESISVPTISLPLPDTLTALQTGMVNAFYGTPIHVLAFQWNRGVDYIYRPAVFYTPSYMVITEKAWQKLPENIRAAFFDDEAMRIKKEALRLIHADDQKSLRVLQSQGTKLVDIPTDQLEEMRRRTRKVWKDMSGKAFPADLLRDVRTLLDEYRGGTGPRKGTPEAP